MKPSNVCLPKSEIPLLLSGDLPPDEAAAAESHIAECESCRSVIESMIADSCWWDDARHSLAASATHVAASLRDAEGRIADAASLGETRLRGTPLRESVLDLLGPTDDPNMLGRIGPYEIIGLLGQGGMGAVFKGFDRSLNRFVAIKMLLPHLAASGAARKRFAREGQAVAAVVDDHVMAIHCVDEWQGVPYLVMTYSRGVSLQKRLSDNGPLEVREILRIGMQAAKGLAAAHAQGIVHRDIKPANIFLDQNVERVQLMDFGLARAVDDASLTRSGTLAGTPQYMSPEQARAETVDHRSDLFSLGSVMYAMCTGHAPFRAESSYSVLRLITDKEPRPIREINPDVHEWLSTIINKLMAKQADDRFSSAQEVAQILEDCLAHVQQPATTPLPVEVQALAAQTQSLSTESVQANRLKARHQRIPPIGKFIAAAAGAFALIFAGILIVLELGKGTLTIESELDNVPIRIMNGDQVAERMTITRSPTTLHIAAGRYIVEADGDFPAIKIKNNVVTLGRGSAQTVKVSEREAETVADKPRRTLSVRLRGDRKLSLADPNASGKSPVPFTADGFSVNFDLDQPDSVFCYHIVNDQFESIRAVFRLECAKTITEELWQRLVEQPIELSISFDDFWSVRSANFLDQVVYLPSHTAEDKGVQTKSYSGIGRSIDLVEDIRKVGQPIVSMRLDPPTAADRVAQSHGKIGPAFSINSFNIPKAFLEAHREVEKADFRLSIEANTTGHRHAPEVGSRIDLLVNIHATDPTTPEVRAVVRNALVTATHDSGEDVTVSRDVTIELQLTEAEIEIVKSYEPLHAFTFRPVNEVAAEEAVAELSEIVSGTIDTERATNAVKRVMQYLMAVKEKDSETVNSIAKGLAKNANRENEIAKLVTGGDIPKHYKTWFVNHSAAVAIGPLSTSDKQMNGQFLLFTLSLVDERWSIVDIDLEVEERLLERFKNPIQGVDAIPERASTAPKENALNTSSKSSPEFPPVKIVVHDEEGKPLEGVKVSLYQIAKDQGGQVLEINETSDGKGMAVNRNLPYGHYELSVKTADGWYLPGSGSKINVEFEKGLDLILVAPTPVPFSKLIIRDDVKTTSASVSELRFGILEEVNGSGFWVSAAPEPEADLGDYETFPTIANGIEHVGVDIRYEIAKSISQPSPSTLHLNTKWKWYPDQAKSSRRYLIVNGQARGFVNGTVDQGIPLHLWPNDDSQLFRLPSSKHRVGASLIALREPTALPLELAIPAGEISIYVERILGRPNAASKEAMNTQVTGVQEELWLEANVQRNSAWIERLVDTTGWMPTILKPGYNEISGHLQMHKLMKSGENLEIFLGGQKLHKNEPNAAEARTLDDVTSVYNEQTRQLRTELFNPPIPDLTTAQMRDAMLDAAEQYRKQGRVEVSSALKISAVTNRLADRLTFMGMGGTMSDGFRQITPQFNFESASHSALLVVLGKAELRYSRNGWSSKTWGDIHPPITGKWELVSVEEHGETLTQTAYDQWRKSHESWTELTIDAASLTMAGGNPAKLDFSIDYDAGLLPQYAIRQDGNTKYSGVLMGNGFIDDNQLIFAVDLEGSSTPQTFHTTDGKTTKLTYRRHPMT